MTIQAPSRHPCNDYFNRIRDFLASIGITVLMQPLPKKGFFSRTYISNTTIFVSENSDISLGEVLHEAGHIATMPSQFRHLIDGDIEAPEILEAIKQYLDEHFHDQLSCGLEDPTCRAIFQIDDPAATAWSYAAALECGVPTEILFCDHESFGGLKQSREIHHMLSLNAYIGINSLAASGMTCQRTAAKFLGKKPFPHMEKWMQI